MFSFGIFSMARASDDAECNRGAAARAAAAERAVGSSGGAGAREAAAELHELAAMNERLRSRSALALAIASAGAWVVLAVARGRFWCADVDAHLGPSQGAVSQARVEAIVPARDEAETVGAAVASLVAQRYGGPFAVTLVDDASEDGTAAIAGGAVAAARSEPDRFSVVPARPLRAPWTGKLSALESGIAAVRAARGEPDFWLFTDADIVHDPTNVAALVAKAERDGLALVSLMVRLRCESGWERLLVPAFVFFFAKLYPFAWSNDPRRSTAAAAGGCVLVRADALARSGGLQAIASELIDDCALAAAIKSAGGAIWIGLANEARSIRPYGSLSSFWRMVKRSAFTQLGRSYMATVVAAAAMALLYAAPPALALRGLARRDWNSAGVAAAAWALMAALYLPTIRAYGRPAPQALSLPIAAMLYLAMTIDSALAHALGRGGEWKGRVL
jgi:hopene-associated glycosyltransferase HpnB